ncbi:MAG: hypothetical protein R6V37_08820 [Psychroflexus maritimus]
MKSLAIYNRFLYLSVAFFFLIVNHTKAQDEFSLHSQFNGSYDFTAIGNTLNLDENGTSAPCSILTESSASLNLEDSQTIEAAYLFWSGSGDGEGNLTINLNDDPVTSEETYNATINVFGNELEFFGAFKDITEVVQNTGNALYTVSDFDLTDEISTFCPSALNYGGWAIIVVYEEESLDANQVNIYKGFEFVNSSNQTASILLGNLNVVETTGAKIGFLSWEGDEGISVNETLQLNGNTLSDLPLNPANNMFNGTNTYSNSSDLWNMDLDVLDISDIIEVGDTEATITMTSGQDGVFLHHVATNISSELPDATVELTETVDEEVCDNRTIDFSTTVFNVNATAVLPENVPVSIFVIDDDGNELYLDTLFTQNTIDINDSENLLFSVTIPENVPLSTQIIIRVNYDESGNNPINESNLNNNEFIYDLQMFESPPPPNLDISPLHVQELSRLGSSSGE